MERQLRALETSEGGNRYKISLPVDFIHELSISTSVQEVLDTVARWLHDIFDAERASVTLVEDEENLKIYAMSGDSAIPRGFSVPIRGTFVGRVFLNRQLQICDDLSTSTELDCEILRKAGLTTCMDAPLLSANKCLGTLNVAHGHNFRYTTQHAIELQCIANWIASNVHLHQQIDKLNYQASVDPLTQSLNRRRFMKDIKTAINYFHLGKEMFFLGFADLDYFKKINDNYGHLAGDQFLQQTVSVIKELLKDNGQIYRLGGEEFGILLSVKDSSAAFCLFESVRRAVEAQIMEYESNEIFATVSIGVTCSQPGDFSVEQLLKRADEAVYKAKSLGRNQVVVWKPKIINDG